MKVLLLEPAGTTLRVRDQTVLEPTAPIVWFVFPDRWYDVARFHLADGTFTGWYTDICTPAVMGKDHWRITDLFLDLWQPVEGDPEWLDEVEFDQAVTSGILSPHLASAAREARNELESLLRRRAWPPDICRNTDLTFPAARPPRR
ncbi:MAG: DUF402 domain-containing protein [Gemmatimonadetes bacterium]|nr:DUF402 domain-containing protein [Gemmatimonadota bacterium]